MKFYVTLKRTVVETCTLEVEADSEYQIKYNVDLLRDEAEGNGNWESNEDFDPEIQDALEIELVPKDEQSSFYPDLVLNDSETDEDETEEDEESEEEEED